MSEKDASIPAIDDLIAGKYRVERELGRGGMGVVLAARHESLGQRVALKLLLSNNEGDQDAFARFEREARASAALTSDHVARVFDVGALPNGQPYMVMEYLEGTDLGEVLERGPLPYSEAVDLAIQALEAISEAHEAGIIHRDLKPSNLFLVTRADGHRRVKVLDFGVSKMLREDQVDGAITTTRSMLGSPSYMSPEQVRSSRNVDARSDIWSMGVILWEAISADILFPGETIGEVFSAILEQPARPLRELRPEVPERLEQIVARCLERDRDKRYPTARELSDELLELASDRTRITMTRPLRAPVVLARTTATVPEGAETLSGDAPLSATAAWTGKPETPKRGGLVAGAALSFVAAIGAIAWFAMRSPAVAEQPATGGRNPVQDLGPQRSSDAAKPAELATVTPTVSLEPTVAPMASASSAPLATPKPGPKATAAPRPTTNAKAKANLPDPLRGRD